MRRLSMRRLSVRCLRLWCLCARCPCIRCCGGDDIGHICSCGHGSRHGRHTGSYRLVVMLNTARCAWSVWDDIHDVCLHVGLCVGVCVDVHGWDSLGCATALLCLLLLLLL
jgi:hypothetical protein